MVRRIYISFLLVLFGIVDVNAAEVRTNTAQMRAMDKITGQVSVVDVPVNKEVFFGSFSIVVRECKTRTPEETPEDFAYVDVADTTFDKTQYNIFKGWMISSSPSLNAVEHPIYDVWLLKCVNKNYNKLVLLNDEQLKLRNSLPKREDVVIESSKEKLIPAENDVVTAEPAEIETEINAEIDNELAEIANAVEESVPNPKEVDEYEKVNEIVSEADDGYAPQLLINIPRPEPEVEPVVDIVVEDDEIVNVPPFVAETVVEVETAGDDDNLIESEIFKFDVDEEAEVEVKDDELSSELDKEINFLNMFN